MHHSDVLVIGASALCAELAANLPAETGLRVAAFEGPAAVQSFVQSQDETPALALVDVEMPNDEAFRLCSYLRRAARGTQVMMVGGRDSDADALRSLEAGAIDYFARPHNRAELLARLRAHLRSQASLLDTEIIVGTFAFKPGQHMLTNRRTGARIWLTAKETLLLRRLHAANGRPLSAHDLLETVWGRITSSTHTVHTHVYRLRAKLGVDMAGFSVLQSVGGGYAALLSANRRAAPMAAKV